MATLTETFTNIANSIRLKTETTDKITPENMPSMIEGITTGGNVAELSITANGTYRAPEGIDGYTPVIVNVPQEGGPTAEELNLTGVFSYRFAYGGWDWIINKYGNQITTYNVKEMDRAFYQCGTLERIPFIINAATNTNYSCEAMFRDCKKLKTIPIIKNIKPTTVSYLFGDCEYLREISDNFCDTWDWRYMESTGAYSGGSSYMFQNCYSLRKIPKALISNLNRKSASGYGIYKSGFSGCYVLDEIVDLTVNDNATYTSNMFSNTFDYCHRLKRLTFKMNEDGTPKVVKWKSQTIDLSKTVNASSITYFINYNSGITRDKLVDSDATYQALKDDPDWFSMSPYYDYARYNKTSAIETINSLPDASAYLATQSSGTNTIKFYGSAGGKTDGGAINTMTEEEIAVATAKGWTVSFG